MRGIDRRLRRLQCQAAADDDGGAALIIVRPGDWPNADHAAYAGARAAGDVATQFAVIERVTGQRPAKDGRIVLIINRPDGSG